MRLRVISTSPSGEHGRYVRLGVVLRQRLLERLQHLAAVLFLFHVDEVDDDDAAQVAQAQLACDGNRGFEVRAVDGLLEIAMPDVRARVDVDRRERFGLVDDQVATRFQRHFAIEGTLDLLFDAVQVEDRAAAGIALDARAECRA